MPDKKEFKSFAKHHLGICDSSVGGHISEQVKGMTRTVIEERPQQFREVDVFSLLIKNRIVFLGTEINSNVANTVAAQLLFLESVAPKKEITLYINSPGGSVYDGLAIYDTMQYISSPVATACIGLAASMGLVLLAGGARGSRTALPNARMMMHQPLGKAQGQMSDMEITVKEVVKTAEDLYKILSRHTGQPIDTIRKDSNRDYWMRTPEAKEYGIIDQALTYSAKEDQ